MTNEITKEILNEIKESLGDEWQSLSEQYRKDIERAAERLGDLTVRHLSGEDVEQPLALVRATVANWKVAGEISASEALEKAFWKGAERAGVLLATFLRKAALGV